MSAQRQQETGCALVAAFIVLAFIVAGLYLGLVVLGGLR